MDSDSTESILNGDGTKEILAPVEGPRENLINTAVKFLQNPKVVSSPLYQKKAFLEKKGLTQQEINLAIQRSGVTETVSEQAPGHVPSYQPGLIGLQSQASPGYYVPISLKSGCARARDFTLTTVVIAGVSYAVYQLFQTYVRPVVLGKSVAERRLERLESQIQDIEKSVADTLAEMNKTLAGIQTALTKQQSQPVVNGGELRGISDLKADIASLKGLLLNKSQFPPAPSTSPVLPSWQRGQVPPPLVAASPSYADVVKTVSTSQNDEQSTEQTLFSGLTDSLDKSPETDSLHAPEVADNGGTGHSDSQDLSYSKLTDSDSSLS